MSKMKRDTTFLLNNLQITQLEMSLLLHAPFLITLNHVSDLDSCTRAASSPKICVASVRLAWSLPYTYARENSASAQVLLIAVGGENDNCDSWCDFQSTPCSVYLASLVLPRWTLIIMIEVLSVPSSILWAGTDNVVERARPTLG